MMSRPKRSLEIQEQRPNKKQTVRFCSRPDAQGKWPSFNYGDKEQEQEQEREREQEQEQEQASIVFYASNIFSKNRLSSAKERSDLLERIKRLESQSLKSSVIADILCHCSSFRDEKFALSLLEKLREKRCQYSQWTVEELRKTFRFFYVISSESSEVERWLPFLTSKLEEMDISWIYHEELIKNIFYGLSRMRGESRAVRKLIEEVTNKLSFYVDLRFSQETTLSILSSLSKMNLQFPVICRLLVYLVDQFHLSQDSDINNIGDFFECLDIGSSQESAKFIARGFLRMMEDRVRDNHSHLNEEHLTELLWKIYYLPIDEEDVLSFIQNSVMLRVEQAWPEKISPKLISSLLYAFHYLEENDSSDFDDQFDELSWYLNKTEWNEWTDQIWFGSAFSGFQLMRSDKQGIMRLLTDRIVNQNRDQLWLDSRTICTIFRGIRNIRNLSAESFYDDLLEVLLCQLSGITLNSDEISWILYYLENQELRLSIENILADLTGKINSLNEQWSSGAVERAFRGLRHKDSNSLTVQELGSALNKQMTALQFTPKEIANISYNLQDLTPDIPFVKDTLKNLSTHLGELHNHQGWNDDETIFRLFCGLKSMHSFFMVRLVYRSFSSMRQ